MNVLNVLNAGVMHGGDVYHLPYCCFVLVQKILDRSIGQFSVGMHKVKFRFKVNWGQNQSVDIDIDIVESD